MSGKNVRLRVPVGEAGESNMAVGLLFDPKAKHAPSKSYKRLSQVSNGSLWGNVETACALSLECEEVYSVEMTAKDFADLRSDIKNIQTTAESRVKG